MGLRRNLLRLLALLFAFALVAAACGSSDDDDSSSSSSESATATADDHGDDDDHDHEEEEETGGGLSQDAVENAVSGDDEAEEEVDEDAPTFDTSTIEGLEASWAYNREKLVAMITEKMEAGEWGVGNEGIGNGLRWALTALEQGRINVAARGVGVAQAAYDAALAYAKERETFGRPISQHQAIAFKLAEMATKLEAARLLTYEAARKADAGERVDLAAGMAKLFASETASELALEAMRIHGGNGFSTEYPVERYYRDAPLMIIGEGTSEIQKLVISRALLAED